MKSFIALASAATAVTAQVVDVKNLFVANLVINGGEKYQTMMGNTY
jgi:hypothetical protein